MQIPSLPRPRALVGAFALCATPFLTAQAAPAAPASTANTDTITLSPFEVMTQRDTGYAATSTLSGGRLATELRNTPAAVSVLTRDFLDDIAATSLQESLQWATNSVAVTGPDISFAGGNESSGVNDLAFGGNSVKVRGVRNATLARNYFAWNVASDTFSTERIDISRGPNALVFGDASLGGIVNTSTKRAQRRNSGSFAYQLTSYGGEGRGTLDVNRALTKTIAVRLAALRQRNQGWVDYSGTDRDGLFATTTWSPRPDLQVRVEGEWGQIDQVNPVSYLRDASSLWDRQTIKSATGPVLTAAQLTAAGLTLNTSANLVYNFSHPELGAIPLPGQYLTNGSAANQPIELRIPQNTVASGTYLISGPATLGAGRLFPVAPDYAFTARNAARRLDSTYRTASAFFEKRFGRTLFIEVSGNFQKETRTTYEPFQANRILIDVNQTLPTGVLFNGSNLNPDYLKPYSQDGMRLRRNSDLLHEARATAVYALTGSWFKQNLGVMASFRRQDFESHSGRLVRVNGVANLGDATNVFTARSLLENRRGSIIDFDADRVHALPGGVQVATRFYGLNSGGGGTSGMDDRTVKSFQFQSVGSWFKGDRLHTIVGIRRDFTRGDNYNVRIQDPVTTEMRGIDASRPATSTKQAVTSPSYGAVYHVLPWLSGFANYSKSFVANVSGRRTPTDELAEAPIGDGYDVGLKFSLLDGRVSASIGYYESKEENNSVNLLGITSQLDAIYQALSLPGSFNGTTDSQTAFAKGYEIDLTMNLTRNWTLMLNGGKPSSTLKDGLFYTRKLVQPNRASWTAAAARIGGTAPAAVAGALSNLDGFFSRFEDGRPVANVRDYTANALTRYTVAEGPLKGFTLGGGIRFLGPNFTGVFNNREVKSKGTHLANFLAAYGVKVWRRDVRLQLTVNNLLGDRNFEYVNYSVTEVPLNYRTADPREFRVSATTRF